MRMPVHTAIRFDTLDREAYGLPLFETITLKFKIFKYKTGEDYG